MAIGPLLRLVRLFLLTHSHKALKVARCALDNVAEDDGGGAVQEAAAALAIRLATALDVLLFALYPLRILFLALD